MFEGEAIAFNAIQISNYDSAFIIYSQGKFLFENNIQSCLIFFFTYGLFTILDFFLFNQIQINFCFYDSKIGIYFSNDSKLIFLGNQYQCYNNV